MKTPMALIMTLTLAMALLGAMPQHVGQANVALASSFIGSGGGAGSFSSIRAFDGMVGKQNVLSALADLRATFGPLQAGNFIRDFDYAVSDAWNTGSRHNLKLTYVHAFSGGPALADRLVRVGLIRDGDFDIDVMFAHLFSPAVERQVQQDMDARYGAGTWNAFTRSGDRFFTDIEADVSASPQPSPT